MVLWDCSIEHSSIFHNVVHRPLFQDQDKTPHEWTFGNQSGISRICNVRWHEWVCYRDLGTFLKNKEKLVRSIGQRKNEGDEMKQSIFTSRGYTITRQSGQSRSTSELHSETDERKRRIFDDIIQMNLGDPMSKHTSAGSFNHVVYSHGADPCFFSFMMKMILSCLMELPFLWTYHWLLGPCRNESTSRGVTAESESCRSI